MKTTVAGGPTITYLRDVTGRVVQRTQATPGEDPVVVRYGHTGGGDGASIILDAAGAVLQRLVGLPGGVTVSVTVEGQAWSYPNLQGSVTVTADAAGVRAAGVFRYDPFGQSVDQVTGQTGTVTADDAGPDTLAGDADFGWLGGHCQAPGLLEAGGDPFAVCDGGLV